MDFETCLIQIRPKAGWTPKTNSRELFLNQSALKVLKSLGIGKGFVFLTSIGNQLEPDDLRKVLIKVSRACELQDFTRVHDIRHTFSSLMQMNGVDRGTVAAILGHRDLSTTLIYTHQTPDHLKASVEKLRV